MFDQKIFFAIFKSFEPGSWSVSGTGDAKLNVLGFGDITVAVAVNKIVNLKTLTDDLYVPGFGVNLFSIGDVTASGLIARLEEDKVLFMRNGEVVLTA